MNKWEYKVMVLTVKRKFLSGQFDAQSVEDELNKFGQDGWELVRMEGLTRPYIAPPVLTFKRPI